MKYFFHVKNLRGRRFGKLIVVKLYKIKADDKNRHARWICRCDCGNEHTVRGEALTSGKTKSCGCLVKHKPGEAGLTSIIDNYKRNARKRGVEFNLSRDEFKLLSQQNCFYCGVSPYQERRNPCYNGIFVYNGIDRLNNNLGYFKENCVSCCGKCNRAKDIMSMADFLSLIEKIYVNHFK